MTATEMKPWAEIPEGRERDAAVAIHIMGGTGPTFTVYEWADRKKRERPRLALSEAPKREIWSDYGSFVNEAGEKLDRGVCTRFPHYSDNVMCDYSVLEFVRREWGDDCSPNYSEALWDAFRWQLFGETRRNRRCKNPHIDHIADYVVGDWSMCAYEAKRLAQGEGKR